MRMENTHNEPNDKQAAVQLGVEDCAIHYRDVCCDDCHRISCALIFPSRCNDYSSLGDDLIDIDRRKYPDWLRHGPERPKPIAILEVPEAMSVEKLARIKDEFVGKGYHIVMVPTRRK